MKPYLIKTILLLVVVSLLSAAVGIYIFNMPELVRSEINENGELILYYSNGKTENLGNVEGKQGDTGAVGKDGASGSDGQVTIVTDDSSIPQATAKGLQSAVSITCTFQSKNYWGQTTTSTSAGSGVIYKCDKSEGEAFIITNYHVVYNESSNSVSENIKVYVYGAEYNTLELPAMYVGGSPTNDIAVLYVSDSGILRDSACVAATIADSEELSIGSTAIAVGNPEGMGISASCGVVSVDSEYITMSSVNGAGQVKFRVMRIDTAVNSGNSGGGLYNASGELIGIVNAKISSSNVENIAYAIPSNLATTVADNIIRNCYQKTNKSALKATLGITVAISESKAVFDPTLGIMRIKETVRVSEISSSSGLVSSVLKEADILLGVSVGDYELEITRMYHALDIAFFVKAGDELTFKILRDGIEQTVSVTVSQNHLMSC